jgi:hypothetical protein
MRFNIRNMASIWSSVKLIFFPFKTAIYNEITLEFQNQ